MESLYNTVFGPKTCNYWKRRDNVPIDPSCILWKEVSLAFHRMPVGLRQFLVKFLSSQCGLGATLQKWRYCESSLRLLCESACDTRDHIFQCTNLQMQTVYQTKVSEVSDLLTARQTHPSLTVLFTRALNRVGNDQPVVLDQVPTKDCVLETALAQDDIGWMNFVLSRWTPQWLKVQQVYFTQILSKKSPKQWSIAIICKLLLVSWDMWTY